MILSDESPSQISDQIKDLLFAKSAERIDTLRPSVSSSLFGENEVSNEEESGVE